MKKRIIPLFLVASLVLQSCSFYDSSIEQDNSFKTAPISTIKQNEKQFIDEINKLDLKNIDTNSLDSIGLPDSIGKYQIICVDDFQKHSEDIIKKYVPSDIYDNKKLQKDVTNMYPFGTLYDDEENHIRIHVGCEGFWSYTGYDNAAVNNYLYSEDDYKDSQVYYISDDFLDREYSSESIEYKIKNAIYSANAFSKDYYAVSGKSIVKPFTAEVNNDIIKINYRITYGGVPINSITQQKKENDDINIYSCPGNFAVINNGKVHTYVTDGEFETYKTIEEYDSIIMPQDAIKLLSDTLSEYKTYSVLGMDLVYCANYIENIEQKSDVNETIREKAEWATYCPYDILEITPYWAIYFELNDGIEVLGLVDCKTGQVYFINNT